MVYVHKIIRKALSSREEIMSCCGKKPASMPKHTPIRPEKMKKVIAANAYIVSQLRRDTSRMMKQKYNQK